MTIKSMSRKRGIGSLVKYIFKEQQVDDKIHQPVTLKHNLSGRDTNRWIKQMEFNESLRKTKRIDSVQAYHEIISFHAKDTPYITRKMLVDIGKKFIEMRGKENIYIIREHRDTKHIHLHVCMSGTQFLTGKANRISKADFDKFRKGMERYQREKYPQLSHSIVYGKEKKLAKKHSRENNKRQINEVLKVIFEQSKSEQDFLHQLKEAGLASYSRSGKITGIQMEDGMKFRFSKLGFDTSKLDRLDPQEQRIEDTMAELNEIRNSSPKIEVERELEEKDRDTDEELTDETNDEK